MLTFNHIVEGMKPSFAKPEFAIAKSKTSQFSNEITFFSMNQRVTIFGFFDSRTSYVFLNKAQWESICHFEFLVDYKNKKHQRGDSYKMSNIIVV